jgi:Lrp/AsnC family leucine-responsive transcriptional regulator
MIGLYITGEADFALLVTARDMQDYEQFTRRFFYENPDIKGFKTMVVMDRVKASFVLPVSASEES